MKLPRFTLLALVVASQVACARGPNLLQNGNAESGSGSTDGSPVPVPGWTTQGNAAVIRYGTSGYLAPSDEGPGDRGSNFFAGGPSDASSSFGQLVDVSAYASAIDRGGVTVTISAYLGGYESQDDYAVFAVGFADSAFHPINGAVQVGPVLAADRFNRTSLQNRERSGPVPPGTRHLAVELLLTRQGGSANDGYADNLYLSLSGI